MKRAKGEKKRTKNFSQTERDREGEKRDNGKSRNKTENIRVIRRECKKWRKIFDLKWNSSSIRYTAKSFVSFTYFPAYSQFMETAACYLSLRTLPPTPTRLGQAFPKVPEELYHHPLSHHCLYFLLATLPTASYSPSRLFHFISTKLTQLFLSHSFLFLVDGRRVAFFFVDAPPTSSLLGPYFHEKSA